MAHGLPPIDALQWVNETRHHTPAERQAILEALSLATRLCDAPEGGYPANMVARIQAEAPALYQHLQWIADEYEDTIPPSVWHTEEVTDPEGSDGIFLALGCASFCKLYEGWQWLHHHLQAAEQALRHLQERRILLSMQQSNMGRIHDDLDRAFQRTLSELRRQQNWRRDRATVTIIPQSEAHRNSD